MVYAKNESSIHENVKKGKEIRASFTGTPQTAKVMATVCDKRLVKMKNALNLYDKSKIWVMAQKREGMSLVHKPSGCAVPTWAEQIFSQSLSSPSVCVERFRFASHDSLACKEKSGTCHLSFFKF